MGRVNMMSAGELFAVNRVGIRKLVKEKAEAVAAHAKRILKGKTSGTGKLASEINVVVSQFDDVDFLVEAQGKGSYTRYYASFVELGTFKDEAQPYLRPAIGAVRRAATRE